MLTHWSYCNQSLALPWNGQRGPQRPRYPFKIICTPPFSSDQRNAFSIPQQYCLNTPLWFHDYVATKAPPSDKKMTQKCQSGPHRPRSLSVPLIAFIDDNQCCFSQRKYVSSRDVCHKVSNWSAMATRNIFDAIAATTSCLKRPMF